MLRSAMAGIEKEYEHSARLAIAAMLSAHPGTRFSELKERLGESDGSLGAHLRRLEEKGLIAVRKGYRGRRPVSAYELTEAGLAALGDHLTALERVLEAAMG